MMVNIFNEIDNQENMNDVRRQLWPISFCVYFSRNDHCKG